MAGKAKDGDGKRPIIIKKIKKGGHGHHGGAWKVAYADFVTAMMAFFLLLWLLSTSSKSKLAGIAEYFTPTIGIKDGQGIGFKGGQSPSAEGIQKSVMSNPGVVIGNTPSGEIPQNEEHESSVEADQDDKLFKEGASAVNQVLNNDPEMQKLKEQITVEQTNEGLKIDLADSDKHPMFEPSNAVLTADGKLMLTKIAAISKRMPRFMSVTGHTDGSPNESGKQDYTNWELSSDRANAARRFMLKQGLDPQQPKKVAGMADKELARPHEPRDPRNRRITIIMLKGQHMLIPDAAAPDDGKVAAPKENIAPAPITKNTEPAKPEEKK